MFQKGQLVRSKDTRRLYEIVSLESTHFMSGARGSRNVALVRRVDVPPMYRIESTLSLGVLELTGNNYKPKAPQ